MYLSVSCVFFPGDFAPHSLQLRRVKYFTLNLMIFFAQFNVELLQHRHACKTNRDIFNLGESLIWVADLIVLECLHLLRIGGEVFWQGGFLTEFGREVLSNTAEVFEK